VAAATLGWYVPPGHVSQTLLFGHPSLSPKLPAAQAKHASELFDPAGAPYVPAGQPRQLADPALGWYVPTAQESQADAPAALYFPAAQSRHAATST
jgi:hypothetical protein